MPDTPQITALEIRAPAPDEWESMYALRWQMLRQPWGQAPGTEQDELESTACHQIAVLPDGRIVGTGRLHRMGDQSGQIRYMAIVREFQGVGIGTNLLNALEDCARSWNLHSISLQARESALSFYEHRGYELIRETHRLYDVIQHHEMHKSL